MKKANALTAMIVLTGLSFAFTTKPVIDARHDNPLLQIVEETFNKTMSISPTHDPNVDFIHYIQSLHQGGLRLADYAIANGASADLKGVATSAKDRIANDLKEMQGALSSHTAVANQSQQFGKDAHDALDELMKKSNNADLTKNVDHDYTILMRRIEDAEREVAKAYMKHSTNPTIKAMADRFIDVKKEEMKELKKEHSDHK